MLWKFNMSTYNIKPFEILEYNTFNLDLYLTISFPSSSSYIDIDDDSDLSSHTHRTAGCVIVAMLIGASDRVTLTMSTALLSHTAHIHYSGKTTLGCTYDTL